MKKIEEAAREFAAKYVGEDSKHFNSMCLAFRAGARYVLDAMTSDAARDAFSAGYIDCDDVLGSSHNECLSAGLASVRKEIEG